MHSKIGQRLLLFDWAAWFGVGLVLYVPVVQEDSFGWYYCLIAVAVAVTFLWGVALVLLQSLTSFLYTTTFARNGEADEFDREVIAVFALGMHAVLPMTCVVLLWARAH